LMGMPFPWDKLRDEMVYIRELHGVMREIRDLCKRAPAPISLMDSLVSMGPGYNIRTRDSVGFYRTFKAEVEERIRQGVGVIPDERIRLGWRSIFPWYKVGHLSRLLAKHGAVLAASAYGMRCYGDDWEEEMPPDGINPDDPLRTIAQEHCLRNANRNMNHRYKWEVERYVREFQLDGLILHSPRTCRPYAMWNHDMSAKAEKEMGIPTLVIEADHTDPKYYAEAQLDTRIEAFIESIHPKPRRPGPVAAARR
ncbi:MAG: 2-hydroxyacyl-CoA dehydratase, partial [Chloroflexi bacterium]|nr:2-hydroxyacyl-CoA dehydratase [Chloroflexota bacterium]